MVSGRDTITVRYSSAVSARGMSLLPGSGRTNSPFSSAAWQMMGLCVVTMN
jgi:hypothetical protein